MKKSRYTKEQIIGILKQQEAGVKTADLCREHGISAATFYGWKQKFGGMDVSGAHGVRSGSVVRRWSGRSWATRAASSATTDIRPDSVPVHRREDTRPTNAPPAAV